MTASANPVARFLAGIGEPSCDTPMQSSYYQAPSTSPSSGLITLG